MMYNLSASGDFDPRSPTSPHSQSLSHF